MKLETERLVIGDWRMEMARRVHQFSLDEDTRRFVPDEVFATEDAARERIAALMAGEKANQPPFVYPVLLEGEYIGYVQAVPQNGGAWEVGYHIGQPYTRRGYAAEAVRAFVPHMMERLGIRRMNAVCLAENAASRRVLEKCGFVKAFDGEGEYQGQRRAVCRYVYELSAFTLRTRRAYDAPAPDDGARVLVDRLWPRGLSRERAALGAWWKEVAPTDALRKWYGHEEARYGEFRERYLAELNENPAAREACGQAREWLKTGNVTLLYAAKDGRTSNAQVLYEWLMERLGQE